MIVHDTAAVVLAVAHAALAWLVVVGVAAGMVACAAVLCVAPATTAARSRLTRPSWARGRLNARILARTRSRRSSGRTAPHWARTQPQRYEEAA